MQNETAFWEAVVTLAPLLALTLVVELRTNRWPHFHALIRNTLITYLFICLAFLFASMVTAMNVLKEWGEPEINTENNANFALFSITVAGFGVVLWPIYNAVFVAQGSGVRKVKTARRASRRRRKAYRTKLSVLRASKHELAIETCERILMNPDGVFLITHDRTTVRVVDPQIVQLRKARKQVQTTHRTLKKSYRKWSKENRVRLERIDRKHGVRYRAKRLRQEGF
jgi:hypothetical protein